MTIGLCVMMKNEERFIKQCIESVKDYVDDIYILDTGSDDRSVEIVKELNIHIHKADFNGDYSAMRNLLLDEVQTDWVLYLDADEYMCQYDAKKMRDIVSTAEDAIGGYVLYRYNFFSTGGWYSGNVLKLFRNRKDIRYKGNISETVEEAIQNCGYKIENSGLLLNHIGHSRSRIERDLKCERYLRSFYSRLKLEPENGLMHAFIGLNSRIIGKFDVALEEAKKAIEINPTSATFHMFYGHVLRSMNLLDAALEEYKIAEKLRKNDVQILNMIGVIYMTIGKIEQAQEYFEKALMVCPNMPHIYINLGLLNYYKEEYTEALKCFEKAITRNPGFLFFDWKGAVECDPYRCFYYETLFSYNDLNTYIDSCNSRIRKQIRNEKTFID